MTMSKWIVRDWMGNDCNLLSRTEFKSFGEARDEINRFADEITGDVPLDTLGGVSNETKEARMQSIAKDLYAVNVDENSKELHDTGQYTM